MTAATFFEAVGAERSTGVAGQIEALLAKTPWLTSTETAKALGKGADHIASLMCKMAQKGRLLRVDNLGPSGGSGFAWNVPSCAARNADALAEKAAARVQKLTARSDAEERVRLLRLCKRAGIDADAPPEPPDWRPEETLPEDHYAL